MFPNTEDDNQNSVDMFPNTAGNETVALEGEEADVYIIYLE